jgi:hypothetical protein
MMVKKLWKELIRLLSVEGRAIKATLEQIRMAVFFIRSVSDTIFSMLFLPKPLRNAAGHLANRRGPQFDKHYCRVLLLTVECFI